MNIVKPFLFWLVLSFAGCNSDDNAATPDPIAEEPSIPALISIQEAGLYPEGIAYDPEENVFYVSSVAQGRISKVSPDGSLETFADDPELISTLGMELDLANNRLLVCVTDPGFNQARSTSETVTQLAAVAIYDLTTGERTDFIQVTSGAPRLANDLILDNAGNIYVTDSFSPSIYKVDTNGNPSTFISNEAFQPQPMSFGLNGMAFHEDGFLIVSKYDEGKLFRIPISDPENFTEITITNGSVPAIDGVFLMDNTTLAISSNNLGGAEHANTLFQLRSTDNWATASIVNSVETGEGTFPTTFTQVNDEVYIQYARLQALVAGNNPAATDFPIVQVNF